MAKGYAYHVTQAERELRSALARIHSASAANSGADRYAHLSWATTMTRSVLASLQQARLPVPPPSDTGGAG